MTETELRATTSSSPFTEDEGQPTDVGEDDMAHVAPFYKES